MMLRPLLSKSWRFDEQYSISIGIILTGEPPPGVKDTRRSSYMASLSPIPCVTYIPMTSRDVGKLIIPSDRPSGRTMLRNDKQPHPAYRCSARQGYMMSRGARYGNFSCHMDHGPENRCCRPKAAACLLLHRHILVRRWMRRAKWISRRRSCGSQRIGDCQVFRW